MKTSTRNFTLGGILALAAILYGWALSSRGWGNSYYSAAVKSMGKNWTNFLFGSYDPAGVVTIDKPPAALWPQVLSAKIFGLHGWSVLLPQVIEGVLTVWLLYLVVRRWAGNGAGLVAAAVLTLTPITVAINRDNNPDTLLVLLLVAAAYALTRAMQTGASRAALGWLCLCGVLVGGGFLTKMLAAWMVVPAFAAAWLIGATGRWWQRLWRLAVAGVVLAVSSLWWVAVVALWPGDRPFIGGSTDGTAWDLVIGYNGLGRVFGEGSGQPGGGMPGGGISFGGAATWDRMFNDVVAGQISWLLPACGAALVVAVVVIVLNRRSRMTGTPLAASGWVLWGGWLIVCAAVFSTQQGIFHPYYTSQLTPAVGALCGGLVVTLWRAHRAGARWVLPVSAAIVAGTAGWAMVVIGREPSWFGWLRWVVLPLAVVAVALLVLSVPRRRLLPVAASMAAVSVLLTPALWSASATWSQSAMGGTNPTAGPAVMPIGRGGPSGVVVPGGALPTGGADPGTVPSGLPGGFPGAPGSPSGFTGGPGGFPGGGFGGDTLTAQQRKILDFAARGSGDARITLAVDGGAMRASAFILNSDATVIAMGGFSGMDNAPSVGQLQSWVAGGELRYVLASGTGQGGDGMPGPGMGFGGGAAQQRTEWIDAHCTQVPAADYGGQDDAMSRLYDCAARSAVKS